MRRLKIAPHAVHVQRYARFHQLPPSSLLDSTENRPSAISVSRTCLKSGALMASTSTVARPMAVRPIWIAARDVRPLMPVTVEAGQGQIIELGSAVVLLCNDVVDLKRKTVVGKGNQAIFAALPRALPNFANQPLVHGRD